MALKHEFKSYYLFWKRKLPCQLHVNSANKEYAIDKDVNPIILAGWKFGQRVPNSMKASMPSGGFRPYFLNMQSSLPIYIDVLPGKSDSEEDEESAKL